MTAPEAETEHPVSAPTKAALVGFGALLVFAVAPLQGVQAWVSLTDLRRWAYTDALFALAALALSVALLHARVRPRASLGIILVAALEILSGEGLSVVSAFAHPRSDDYLSSWLNILGFLVVAVSAAAGLVSTLLWWARRLTW